MHILLRLRVKSLNMMRCVVFRAAALTNADKYYVKYSTLQQRVLITLIWV